MAAAPTTRTDAPAACGCGCGQATTRRYRPGHDAKHKSSLMASLVDGSWVARCRAADTLADLGWDHLAPLASLRPVAYRTGTLAVAHADQVARWQMDHLGCGHANRRCPRLTAAARQVGGTNAITRLASDAYVTLTDARPTGWDLCEACATDRSRDEWAEYRAMTRRTTIDPVEVAAKGRAARTRHARKMRAAAATPAPWQAPTTRPIEWNPTPTTPTPRPTISERADAILARILA